MQCWKPEVENYTRKKYYKKQRGKNRLNNSGFKYCDLTSN